MDIASWKWPAGLWMVSETKETPSSVQRREGEGFQKRCKRGGRGGGRRLSRNGWGALGRRQGCEVDIGTTTRCGDSGEPESDGLT